MMTRGEHIGRIPARLMRSLLNVVLPATCLTCETRIGDGAGLCPDCWAKLHVIGEPVCNVYGTPMPYGEAEEAVSARAVANPPAWDRARGAVIFNEQSQRLVHALKYSDRHEMTAPMAVMMSHAGRKLIAGADVVVPVPLHRWRLWSRRYNQSALLAAEIARNAKLSFNPQALVRKRNTRAQVGLDSAQRSKNVKQAFAVPERYAEAISGKRVLLVDDVLTSGSTASECAKKLKKAGANHVDLLTFALVSV